MIKTGYMKSLDTTCHWQLYQVLLSAS